MWLLLSPCGLLALFVPKNNCCTRRNRKHSRHRQTHGEMRTCQVCKLLSLSSLHRCLQGHSMAIKTECMQGTQLDVRSTTPGLSVVVERINYLCGNSWSERSRFETQPTEAVFTDRKVRGHAGKHVVGARLQDESWAPGRRMIRYLLQIFCKVMPSAMCVTDTEDPCIRYPGKHFRQQIKYSLATTSQRPNDRVFSPLIEPQVKDLIILSAVPSFLPAQSIYI